MRFHLLNFSCEITVKESDIDKQDATTTTVKYVDENDVTFVEQGVCPQRVHVGSKFFLRNFVQYKATLSEFQT